MLNPFKDVDWNPDIVKRRAFARSLIVGFPCIALLLIVGGYVSGRPNLGLAAWLAGVGAGAGFVFWMAPAISRPFYLAWYGVACSVGLVVGNLLMAVVYYVVVTGLGLLRRLIGGRRRWGIDRSAPTYWLDGPRSRPSRSYYHQF